METSIFNCPKCGKPIKVECPHCGATITTPQRPETTSAKADASGEVASAFLSYVKRMTKREFWTLKHSAVVGLCVLLVVCFVGVVLLLCGNDTSSKDRGIQRKKQTEAQELPLPTHQKEAFHRAEIEPELEKACVSGDVLTYVEYNGVIYALDKNDNFIVRSLNNEPDNWTNPDGYWLSEMRFFEGRREEWWQSVRKCADTLKYWIRVSQENQIKYVRKEMPRVCPPKAILCRIRSIKPEPIDWSFSPLALNGRGGESLPPSGLTEPKFIGCVRAGRFKRDPYEVSITVECGGWFRREILSVSGTVDEIEKEIIRFLIFADPYRLMRIRSQRAKDSALFN